MVSLYTLPLFCETNDKEFPSALSGKPVTVAKLFLDVLTKKGNRCARKLEPR